MDDAVKHLLTQEALMLGLLAFIGTFLIRRVVETAVPSLKKKADANAAEVTYETTMARWWNEAILYALPVVVGVLVAVFDIDFIFENLGIKTMDGRIVMGVITGFSSGFAYKLLRKVVKKVTGVDLVPTRGGSVTPDQPVPPATPKN